MKVLCPQIENIASEISAGEMVQAGVDVVKNKICEGVDDAKKKDAEKKDAEAAEEVEEEAKDETESGFQTNFLSATLIALCALFKL